MEANIYSGIKVIVSPYLPANTMVVSQDVFDSLKTLPDGKSVFDKKIEEAELFFKRLDSGASQRG